MNSKAISCKVMNNQIAVLTSSLNEARAANAQVVTQASSPVGSGEKVDEDTLREIANNNVQLKEIEAQLASIVTYGGIEGKDSKNSKEADEANDEAVKEAQDRA